MSGIYLIISILSYFFFPHHPAHIGIIVNRNSKKSEGFFLDYILLKGYNLAATHNNKFKQRVTILDAFSYFPYKPYF